MFGGVSLVPSEEEEEGEEEPKPSKERCAAGALSPLAARLTRPVAANSWPGEAVAGASAIASGAAPAEGKKGFLDHFILKAPESE